jgi:hypothetical protein
LMCDLRALGDGSDRNSSPGSGTHFLKERCIAVPTFKPDPGEMRRV